MVSIRPNGMGKGKKMGSRNCLLRNLWRAEEEFVDSMSFKITNAGFSFSSDILISFSWTWKEQQHSSLVNHRCSRLDKWLLIFLGDKDCVWLLLQFKGTGDIIQSGVMIRSNLGSCTLPSC
jgi:hypothetical protein